jgi:hypothetical protein
MPQRHIGEWWYNSMHSWPRHQMEVSDQLHVPATLPPEERAPDTHWMGGWVGSIAILDVVVKREIPSPCRESNPNTLIVQPVAQSLYRLSYHGSSKKMTFTLFWTEVVLVLKKVFNLRDCTECLTTEDCVLLPSLVYQVILHLNKNSEIKLNKEHSSCPFW